MEYVKDGDEYKVSPQTLKFLLDNPELDLSQATPLDPNMNAIHNSLVIQQFAPDDSELSTDIMSPIDLDSPVTLIPEPAVGHEAIDQEVELLVTDQTAGKNCITCE